MPYLIELYVDTNFLDNMSPKIREKFPAWGPLEHTGFGDFHMDTPHGRLRFERLNAVNIPNQKGRSHQVWGPTEAKKELLSLLLLEEGA